MSSYAEKLEKHGLLYEDVEKKVNKSLVAVCDNRIHRMGVAEANLTKRLRYDNGGELPGTLKAYNELANKIIEAVRRTFQHGSYILLTLTIQLELSTTIDRPTPRDTNINRCSGCGNAGHHHNECFHANSTWFNKKGGDYRLSDKGKAYKAKYKHTRISF
eukprot:gene55484-76024_t